MNLKEKLALRSTLICALTLLIVCACTLYFFSRHIAGQFYSQLGERALTSAIIFLERDELSQQKYRQYVRQYNQTLDEERVQVYDSVNRVVFVEKLAGFPVDANRLNRIRRAGIENFKVGDRQYSGIFYRDNQGDFVIITSAIDLDGQAQLYNLAMLLAIFILVGIAINYGLNVGIAKQTFEPFSTILQKVNTISTQNLNERLLPVNTSRDELHELVTTLNTFLVRLENEVNNQKQFLKNVSHELKTPLTAIIGQAEVCLEKEGSALDYRFTLQKIVKDTYSLKSVIEGLLLISGLNTGGHKPGNSSFRMDELIWQVLEQLKFKYPEAVIHTSLEIDVEDESLLEIYSPQELIATACLNIIDNAIKFSRNQTADIVLTKQENRLALIVRDNGPGIPLAEADSIYTLFYRASNVKHIPGHGVGLSITRQIMDYCHVTMHIQPANGQGTEVRLLF